MTKHYDTLSQTLENYIDTFDEEFSDAAEEDLEQFVLNFISDPAHYINFGTGLSFFLQRHGYTGDLENTSEKIKYLSQALEKQGLSLEPKTLSNWFTNKVRPMYKENQREAIYKICFALELSHTETKNFFNHIYFDRPFNFRYPREFVYYFCLKNHLNYQEAVGIIDAIKTHSEVTSPAWDATILTSHIQRNLQCLTTPEAIIDYVVNHPNNFSKYNVSVVNRIDQLLGELLGSDQDKARIQTYRKTYTFPADPEFDSITVREAYLSEVALPDTGVALKADSIFAHRDVTSIDFLLSTIYQLDLKKSSAQKVRQQFESSHPLFVRQITDMLLLNFPDKKGFSNILASTKERKASYDAMRKALILLHFYKFWTEDFLENGEYTYVYDDYIDCINAELIALGLGQLYVVNPYDRLFMICATTEEPLTLFREIIAQLFTL